LTKTSVYIETTVIGHLATRLQPDVIVAGRQLVSRQWWDSASAKHDLFISDLVIEECSAGDPIASEERLALIVQIPLLANSDATALLTQSLLDRRAIPQTEPRDASHISIAATNGIQYLVTWNFKHIANVSNRDLIEAVCRDQGFDPPKICTPDELLGMYDD
jgi:predicted nucleic acid-binding protein